MGAGSAVDPEEKLEQILSLLKEKKVLIYGAGSFGKEMYRLLNRHEIPVRAFLDRGAAEGQTLYGLPVRRADEPGLERLRGNSLVLFSIVMDKRQRTEALRFLRACGFKEVMESQAVRCLSVRPDDMEEGENGSCYYKNRGGRISEGADLFEEKASRRIFETNIMGHVTRDYAECASLESPMEQQYFPPGLFGRTDYSRFVDCGGYTGDSLYRLVRNEGNAEAAAAFEPDPKNFSGLSETCDRLRDRIGQIILFPCAVSGRTGMAHFHTADGSGTLDLTGDMTVQTVSLDMALKGFAPTFIKMDIEGEERNALKGAENMVGEYRPNLAVCVYHHVNHLWDIPLLIHSWGLGYHFYLRTYNSYTMETVLYAKAKD